MRRVLLLSTLLFTFNAQAFDFCASLEGVKTEADYQSKLKTLIGHQNITLKHKVNRYQVGRTLNNCTPSKNSEGLFLSFAGTGAYNPRTYDIMAKLIKCPHVRHMPKWLQKKSYSLALSMLEEKKSNYTKWSTIEKGPMTRMIMSGKLKSKMANFDFAIYPSEESEMLAGMDELKLTNVKNWLPELTKSVMGYPTGIKNALRCTNMYLNAMKKRGKTGKIVIMSHSSGGRSVVKYLEKLKTISNQNASLVLTIDPVKEAHHALQEVLPQLGIKYTEDFAEWIFEIDLPEKEVAVWSRSQPKVLYKTTNTDRWINFYQIEDTEGLRMEPKFGIKGSPIYKADENIYISNGLGSGAHGAIGYHSRLKDKVEDELLEL